MTDLLPEAESLADESRRLYKALQLGTRGYAVNDAAVRDHVEKALRIVKRMHGRLNPEAFVAASVSHYSDVEGAIEYGSDDVGQSIKTGKPVFSDPSVRLRTRKGRGKGDA